MTSIEPQAFDRTLLIEAIKATQKKLGNLLIDAEHGELEAEILHDTDKQLVKIRQLIKERVGLLTAIKLL